MEIKTTRFGTIQFPADLVLSFPGGLLGFPHAERFAVLDHDQGEASPFKWIQAVEDPSLAFIVIEPTAIIPDYQKLIEKEIHDALGPHDPQDISLAAIVTVPSDNPIEMTANLRAPIAVKFSAKEGQQIILTDDRFEVRHRIFAGQPVKNGETTG